MACSTAKAVEWDAAWSKNLDPSGRAALGVHVAAYEDSSDGKNVSGIDALPSPSPSPSPQKVEVDKTVVAV